MTPAPATPTDMTFCSAANRQLRRLGNPLRRMSEQLPPFRAERYAIGPLRNGVAAALQPMTAKGARILGPAAAAIGPWAHYGFDGSKLAESLGRVGDSVKRYQIECDGEIAGAVVIVCPWLSGPYLQMLAILPPYQKRG